MRDIHSGSVAPPAVFVEQLDMTHLRRLTNSVGIVQHAKYATPDYRHGYCVDDNSRAIMLCGMANKIAPSIWDDLIDTYLAFLVYMQRDDGRFRNFLSFDHRFLDDFGTEDAFGRTMWSLGSLMKNEPRVFVRRMIKEIIDRSFPHITTLQSIRAVSYTLCGLVHLVQSKKYDKALAPVIEQLSDWLVGEFSAASSSDWDWFESVVSYDNGIVPYSLFLSGGLLDNDVYLSCAIRSACFLDRILFDGGETLDLVGNMGWYRRGGQKSIFGQQAVEIPSLIVMYQKLSEYLPDRQFARKPELVFRWFFGNNYMNAALYDPSTHGCRDGLDAHSINQNQGAESCISFWQAYLYYVHNVS